MYVVHITNETEIEPIRFTPGLLSINEAENHLRPKWQKLFLRNILQVLPYLQITLSTH